MAAAPTSAPRIPPAINSSNMVVASLQPLLRRGPSHHVTMRHVPRRGAGVRIFQPRGVRIAGTGAYLPARIVTNAELAAEGAPLGDEEIVKLSGIRARHRA